MEYVKYSSDIKAKIDSELDCFDFENICRYFFKKGTKVLHNPYGPAIEWSNGHLEYFIYNIQVAKDFKFADYDFYYLLNNKRYFK